MKYTIHEPKHELTEGYFMFLLKSSVLFLSAWMLGILILYTYPCLVWSGNKFPDFLIFLNDFHLLSWFCVVLSLFLYWKKQLRSYNIGIITEIEINPENKIASILVCNTLTGKENTFKTSEIKTINFNSKHSSFYGDQRYFHFLDKNNQIISTLAPDRSPWNKNETIDQLIKHLQANIS
jgi:hypothetical protein